jgi:hypothetical protein
MRQITKSSGNNTVAIFAIIAGAVVGVIGPLIAATALARRSKQELDASAARQRDALDAERERLQATLQAEGQRRRRDTERKLLDRGTVLIAEFRTVVADIKLDARGKPIVTDPWREVVHEVAAFRGRLLLWFDDNSAIVEAFDEVMQFTAWSTTWVAELGSGDRKVRLARLPEENHEQMLPRSPERTLEDVDITHLRYVVAARAHLGS